MNKKFAIIILTASILVAGIAGCNEPKQAKQNTHAKTVRLSDIQPAQKPDKPTEMAITVLTYEIPEKNKKFVEQIYEELSKQYIKFPDLNVFQDNGFIAGFGMPKNWPVIADLLFLAHSSSTETNNLIFIDSSSSDIVTGATYEGQTFYLSKRRQQHELVKLPAGQLVWRVSARALPNRQGIGLAQIKAVHKEDVLPALTKLPGYENVGETPFNDIAVKLNITPGEFVIIGPDLKDSDRITLSEFFFKRIGDIIAPVPPKQQQLEQTDMKYKLDKNVPLIRLYVFICTGIKN